MTVSTSLRRKYPFAWALLLLLPGTVSSATWRVKVEGQGADLNASPIVAPLDASIPAGEYVLRPAAGGKEIPAHIFQDNGHSYLATVLDHISSQASESFVLEPLSSKPSGPQGIELKTEGKNIHVSTGGKPFTVYRTDEGPKPFYYPVQGPSGAFHTRSYPMKAVPGEDKDHPHQRSLWFTHGKVNGVDFWSETKGHGSIKETSRKSVVGGSTIGLIRTTDDWFGPQNNKICEDERTVRFFDTGATRIIDFDITLRASEGDLTFGDTKEGMFGIRVASTMDVIRKLGGKITNADGLIDDKAWGKPSSWVDYTGPVEKETVGIAVLNHPSSFRYPTTWHVRTYGLFAANPFGWHDFGKGQSGEYILPSGQTVSFRYRVILHTGDTSSANIASAFQAYANPPKITVEQP